MKIMKLISAIRLLAILLGLSSGGLLSHAHAADATSPVTTVIKTDTKSETEEPKSEAKKSEKDDDDKDEEHEDKDGDDGDDD